MIISLLLLSAVTASAQTSTDLGSSFIQAQAAVAAKTQAPQKAPKPAVSSKGLETSFEITITFADGRDPLKLKFTYTSRQEVGRNDYLPPYTQRTYDGQDGYALTIVTDQGQAESRVLLSHGKDWVGEFNAIENAKLVSGDSLSVGDVELKGTGKGKAVLHSAASH